MADNWMLELLYVPFIKASDSERGFNRFEIKESRQAESKYGGSGEKEVLLQVVIS